MSKITLTNLVNLQNETTAVNTVNNNNATLTAALDNTISRDGTSPNAMNASIDMNSNKIINLAPGVANTDAVNIQQMNTVAIAHGNVPTGGTTNQVLSKTSNADFATGWVSSSSSVNLTGPITATASVTSITSQTGTGTKFVVDTNPALIGPNLGTPTVVDLTNATNVPAGNLIGTIPSGPFPVLTGDVTTPGASLATTIGTNKVANTQLAQAAAYTIKGNNSASLANVSDIDVTALTAKPSPISNDVILIQDSAVAGFPFKKATVGSLATIGSVASFNGITGAISYVTQPQGRLTLQTGVPVMNTNTTGATTVYYDSYIGNQVPVWNGSSTVQFIITADEVSMGLAAANVISGSLYDVWAINNSGVFAIGVGPAWSTTLTRGTGAGTNELQFKNGIRTNKNTLTNLFGGAAGVTNYGPIASNQATLLGTILATANGATSWTPRPAATGGGGSCIVGVSNAYNQLRIAALNRDSTASWALASTTWRRANSSATNVIKFVDSIQQNYIEASYYCTPNLLSSAGLGALGIEYGPQLDWTTGAPDTSCTVYNNNANASQTNVTASPAATGTWFPALGLHQIDAVEAGFNATSQTIYGSGWGSTAGQMQGLTAKLFY